MYDSLCLSEKSRITKTAILDNCKTYVYVMSVLCAHKITFAIFSRTRGQSLSSQYKGPSLLHRNEIGLTRRISCCASIITVRPTKMKRSFSLDVSIAFMIRSPPSVTWCCNTHGRIQNDEPSPKN
jgi:hypothetical protein